MSNRRPRRSRRVPAVLALIVAAFSIGEPSTRADVSAEQVESAIAAGIKFLRSQQAGDGTWSGEPGVTALATLALLTAGEPPDSPRMVRALEATARLQIPPHHETYTIALKIMALSAGNPTKYQDLIARLAERLQATQFSGNLRAVSGGWTYGGSLGPIGRPDNSNAQYAMLGLNAASEIGIPIRREVWDRARRYWEDSQNRDGGWTYVPGARIGATGSMTCAGLSGLVFASTRRSRSLERLSGDDIVACGETASDPAVIRAIDWLTRNFSVVRNPGSGSWNFYYLYGLERAGRLTGRRFFGRHDWYREGAEHLVITQDPFQGNWAGSAAESNPVVATSFALLFLAKGRDPILINKLVHGPAVDWNNDIDDVARLTDEVSRDWKRRLTWQVVDPSRAAPEDLQMGAIAFFNGHDAPEFSPQAKKLIRDYVDQGGCLVADACCSRPGFDAGFRSLMKELFPEPESELHPLPPEHPIWTVSEAVDAESHPLWGIERGCRTVVIYSPEDLSCYWNKMETDPSHPKVVKSRRLGRNIVDYLTGREPPPNKLVIREAAKLALEPPKRGALQIAKLRHAGDWNVAPLAVPNLAASLRERLKFDVVINHKELYATDPNLIHFPLIYFHGRVGSNFGDEERAALRRHFSPGGGTLFADSACGGDAFDLAFRKFVVELLPEKKLEPIPPDDDLLGKAIGYDLSDCSRTKAAGGAQAPPLLEGIKINGRWAVIYSKLDLGCALQKQSGPDCKGYTYESAVRIASNIVIYSTLP